MDTNLQIAREWYDSQEDMGIKGMVKVLMEEAKKEDRQSLKKKLIERVPKPAATLKSEGLEGSMDELIWREGYNGCLEEVTELINNL